jgi:hypothetical protein
MASGHVNRTNRPNTWLHRPTCKREDKALPTRSRPHMARSCKVEPKTNDIGNRRVGGRRSQL